MNTNVLQGISCPSCGSLGHFTMAIEVRGDAVVSDDGWDDIRLQESEFLGPAVCWECGHDFDCMAVDEGAIGPRPEPILEPEIVGTYEVLTARADVNVDPDDVSSLDIESPDHSGDTEVYHDQSTTVEDDEGRIVFMDDAGQAYVNIDGKWYAVDVTITTTVTLKENS
jgi:hypothetical protein